MTSALSIPNDRAPRVMPVNPVRVRDRLEKLAIAAFGEALPVAQVDVADDERRNCGVLIGADNAQLRAVSHASITPHRPEIFQES